MSVIQWFRVTGSESLDCITSGRGVLREVHDAQCSCNAENIANCVSEGVPATVFDVANALLRGERWSTEFEDGWLAVELIADPIAAATAAVTQ